MMSTALVFRQSAKPSDSPKMQLLKPPLLLQSQASSPSMDEISI